MVGMDAPTPTDVLSRPCAVPPSKRVVLLTTGSLNPVHTGHVQQLEEAKRHIEAHSDSRVVAGFISPSDAAWAAGKGFRAVPPLRTASHSSLFPSLQRTGR